MKLRYLLIFILSFTGIFFLNSCNDNPVDRSGIFPPTTIPFIAYNSPIWYPNGEFIGFNHTPIKSIHYSGNNIYPDKYELESDSSGFWLVNSDGTNMRRILPYQLQCPAWSPDGKWIAFVANAQIYKMKFTGTTFDTTTLVQLTTEGRNFFPSWSPDGQWIAYNESICDTIIRCGIWLMTSDGAQNRFLAAFGNYPDWKPNNLDIIYLTRAVTSSGQVIGDSLWLFNTQTEKRNFLQFLGEYNYDNRYLKYSSDSIEIAFTSQPVNSQPQIWIMNADGSGKHQLTTEGVETGSGVSFSWNPTGNFIVYTKYRFDSWPPQNGTLWIININTGQQQQLTFNPLSTN